MLLRGWLLWSSESGVGHCYHQSSTPADPPLQYPHPPPTPLYNTPTPFTLSIRGLLTQCSIKFNFINKTLIWMIKHIVQWMAHKSYKSMLTLYGSQNLMYLVLFNTYLGFTKFSFSLKCNSHNSFKKPNLIMHEGNINLWQKWRQQHPLKIVVN